jgi:Tfp pilus assembly protein PilO
MRSRRSRALWVHLRWPLLVVLAVNAAIFAGFTLPRTVRQRNLESRLGALRRQVTSERRSLEELTRRSQAIQANVGDTERFLGEVATGREQGLAVVLVEIEAIAARAGLRLRSRTYTAKDVKDLPLVEIGIMIPVEGSYAQLVSFIDQLEQSEHFLVVDRVQLRQGSEPGEDQLTVGLLAYFREGAERADVL